MPQISASRLIFMRTFFQVGGTMHQQTDLPGAVNPDESPPNQYGIPRSITIIPTWLSGENWDLSDPAEPCYFPA
ncbi:hypothetical protein TNCT_248311 [Trichonephila clavata]|uniref:Uncharacterized protein n=1 Tax=Trichonephila clavata TaxID=2740835 RepID=A0A8X6LZ34_TRICU|nr:hypothetical protein TNCT_248311 [Trichonephila clavata]